MWIASDEIWPIEENLQRHFVPNHTASCSQLKGPPRFLEHNLSQSLFAQLSAGLDRSHQGLCPDLFSCTGWTKTPGEIAGTEQKWGMCERISLYYLYNVLHVSLPADGIHPTICSVFDSLRVICSQLSGSPRWKWLGLGGSLKPLLMYIDEVPFVWSVCVCVCPHIYCVFSTRILVLPAKLGRVCEVESDFKGQTRPWNLTKERNKNKAHPFWSVTQVIKYMLLTCPLVCIPNSSPGARYCWQDSTPAFPEMSQLHDVLYKYVQCSDGNTQAKAHKGAIFWGSVLGLWLVGKCCKHFFICSWRQLSTRRFNVKHLSADWKHPQWFRWPTHSTWNKIPPLSLESVCWRSKRSVWV